VKQKVCVREKEETDKDGKHFDGAKQECLKMKLKEVKENPTLTSFHLNGDNNGQEDFLEIADAISQKNSSVTKMTLQGDKMYQIGVSAIAAIRCNMRTSKNRRK
jgi:hypothetical protein